MSTYKIGDRVRVRSHITETSGTPGFVDAMDKYRGEPVTIVSTYLNPNAMQRYFIHEDGRTYTWCDEFFEPYDGKDTYEYW